MSQAQYAIYLTDSTGTAFRENITGQLISLDATRITNDIGKITLEMDPSWLDESYFKRDCRILVYRSLPGRNPSLLFNTLYLLRNKKNRYAGTRKTRILYGYDLNSLLARRIIAYYAGTAQAKKSAIAIDNMMKDFVDEQFGAAATDATRRLTSYLTIAGDVTLAPVSSKAAAWRPLLQVLQELAQASAEQGTFLAFDLYAQTETAFLFQTFEGQRGIDRRQGSGNDFILSMLRGNIDNISIEYDWQNEITRVYAGGQGVETERNIQSATSARSGTSIFGIIEDFSDIRHISQTDTTAALQEAYARLREARPRVRISGDIIETDGAIYDVHYAWGDYVTVNIDDLQADCRLDIARCKLERSDRGMLERFDLSAVLDDDNAI